jgi:hypothetical protein
LEFWDPHTEPVPLDIPMCHTVSLLVASLCIVWGQGHEMIKMFGTNFLLFCGLSGLTNITSSINKYILKL